MQCVEITVSDNISLYHRGPSLDLGPLPSCFYFALSGRDSLTKDPYNQVVEFLLAHSMIRLFSLTIPGHEEAIPPQEALYLWQKHWEEGNFFLPSFLEKIETSLSFAIEQQWVLPEKISVAGLSRGAWIAAHIAAQDPRFTQVVGFSPLTTLKTIVEFASVREDPTLGLYDSIRLAPFLSDREISLFIGNEDTRVGSRNCFDFLMELVHHKKGRRPPQADLYIYPSIGLMGHGTPPYIFQKGAKKIEEHLLCRAK